LGFLLLLYWSSFFPFHANDSDLGETFFKARRAQLGSQAPHHIVSHHPIATLIAFETNLKGNIEINGVYLVAEITRQLDPALAIVRRKVGCIDVVHGSTRN